MLQFFSYLLLVSGALCLPADDQKAPLEPEYLDKLLAEGKYEEFSEAMGIDNVEMVKPTNEPYPMFNKDLEFGDMMPVSEKQAEGRQILKFDQWPSMKWSGGYVPYVIAGGNNFTDNDRRTIQRGINEWNNNLPCFRLQPRRGERDYVYVFKGSGCWSYLGKIGNEQGLSLGNGCVIVSTLLHEFMHAIGFAHEHTRTDRDDWVEVLWHNIPEGWHSQYRKMNPNHFHLHYTRYDYASVMHYPYRAPDTNEPAFRILRHSNMDREKMGWVDSFSDIDKERVRATYCS